MAARIFYQEDCNLICIRGTDRSLSSVMVARDMHMH